MNYYCEHNICPMTTTLPPSTDTIIVDRDVHFDQIVAVCNVKAEEVKALNPQYRTGLIPGAKKSCILRLPTHGISAFIAAGDSVYTYKSDELFTNRSEVAVSQSAKNHPLHVHAAARAAAANREPTPYVRERLSRRLRNVTERPYPNSNASTV